MSEEWKRYEADFNGMTDEEIEGECKRERENLEAAEEWLEAVASWIRAGKPRKP